MLPTGTVTLVLGDVENSTRAWESGGAAMGAAVGRMNELVDELVGRHDGVRPMEQGEGDSFVAAFSRARDAAACALALQQAFRDLPLRVRIGVHAGDVQRRGAENYVGPTIIRAARLRDLGHGGQTVLSQTAADLAGDSLPDGASVRDLGVHRLKDLSRPERVFQLCHPDLGEEFPPLRSLDAHRHNLPVQRTTLVGRTAEMAEVRSLLSRSTLVTLVGSGGVGKSRLALHVAAAMLDDFPDGVWLAELAPVVDPGAVATHVGQVFALDLGPGRSPAEALAAYLADKTALLLLDNCEHVLGAAAELADTLIASCPNLGILATSRQPLDLPGEIAWRVPSLQAPEENMGAGLPGVSASEAVQLFAERAGRARPGFVLSDRNAAHVAEICRRLDGIPLAIELAAARVRVFTPAQIADGLDERFRLLTGAPRTALPRQQTLEASVDWSYRLLTEPEQVVFRRLAVFAGDFSYDAAVAVCSASDIHAHQVLDLLGLLVDKSLIQVDDDGDQARYRLLETLRYYAGGHLAAAGEEDDARQRHRDHYLAFAEEAEGHLEGPGQTEWIGRVATDYPNIRASLAWSRDRGQGEPLARTAAALEWFWVAHGPAAEGNAWLRTALDHLDPSAVPLRAKTLWASAFFAAALGSAAACLARSEEGLALARELHDERLVARLRVALGTARYRLGQVEEAIDVLEQAVAAARQFGDRFALVVGLGGISHAKKMQNPAEARPYLEEAVRVARDLGQVVSEYVRLGHLVQVLRWLGELNESADLSDQLINNAQRSAHYLSATMGLANQAAVLVEMDRQSEASATVDRLEAAARQGAYKIFDYNFAIVRSQLALSQGDQAGALSHAHDAIAAVVEPAARCEALTAVIEAELSAANLERAGTDIDAMVATAETGGLGYWLAYGLVLKARRLRLAGDPAGAEEVGHQALTAAAAVQARCRIVDAFEVLAGAAADLGDSREAGRLFGAADAIRESIGYRRSVYERAADVDTLRAQLGADDLDAVMEPGRGLSLDEAIAYARRGRGERKRPSQGWASLTPTETQVVALVEEGLSNPEIARRLICSPRTVQAHLTHIFTKLSVTSRAELTARAIERRHH
jgi:predicted ATPase/class 3 adenylate cyclase/DNA-binding CsgD family transcriptional regulator